MISIFGRWWKVLRYGKRGRRYDFCFKRSLCQMCRYNLGFENLEFLLPFTSGVLNQCQIFHLSGALNLHGENIWWTQTEIHPTGYQTSIPHNYEAIKYWEALRKLLQTGWGLEDTRNGMLWLGPWNRERTSGKKTLESDEVLPVDLTKG